MQALLPVAATTPADAVQGGRLRKTTDSRASRRRTIGDGPLVRLGDAAETGSGFGKTFVNDRQQRPRRERLEQAAPGAEFERHAQEGRRRRVEVGSLSRLSLPARNLCDSKALPPIQEFLAG